MIAIVFIAVSILAISSNGMLGRPSIAAINTDIMMAMVVTPRIMTTAFAIICGGVYERILFLQL